MVLTHLKKCETNFIQWKILPPVLKCIHDGKKPKA